MYKCKIKECPSIFYDVYKLKPRNKYSTRSKKILAEPKCKTKTEQFVITYRAPHIWNEMLSINNEISNIETYFSLKKKVKEVILVNEKLLSNHF